MGILARLDAEPGRWDLSAMKAMLVGGSAVPRAMIAAFEERHGLKICQGWGMTETSPVASTVALPYDLAEADAETRWDYQAMVGVPLPFVEIRVRVGDEDVPWDGEAMGELEVRRPVGRGPVLRRARVAPTAGRRTAGSAPATSSRSTRAASSRSRTARRT